MRVVRNCQSREVAFGQGGSRLRTVQTTIAAIALATIRFLPPNLASSSFCRLVARRFVCGRQLSSLRIRSEFAAYAKKVSAYKWRNLPRPCEQTHRAPSVHVLAHARQVTNWRIGINPHQPRWWGALADRSKVIRQNRLLAGRRAARKKLSKWIARCERV